MDLFKTKFYDFVLLFLWHPHPIKLETNKVCCLFTNRNLIEGRKAQLSDRITRIDIKWIEAELKSYIYFKERNDW